MRVVRRKELLISAENKVGLLKEISEKLSNEQINIESICAYVVDGKAFFRMVVSDSEKAKEILKPEYSIEEREVLVVSLANQIGRLYELTSKISDANIDLTYIYGTTSEADEAKLILSSLNNDEIINLLS